MAKSVEVLIKIINGTMCLPSSIPPRLSEREHPYDRTGEIVEIIKSEGAENQIFLNDTDLETLKGDGKIHLCGDYKGYYVIYNPVINRPCFYKITSVKTNRPWCIYRSAKYGETIRYFEDDEKIKIIDAELNYAKKVN